jgi:hypothetical protein
VQKKEPLKVPSRSCLFNVLIDNAHRHTRAPSSGGGA